VLQGMEEVTAGDDDDATGPRCSGAMSGVAASSHSASASRLPAGSPGGRRERMHAFPGSASVMLRRQRFREGTRSDDRSGSCIQHKNPTSPGAGEDQHGNNTDKTALPGTRQHGC